MPRIRKPYKLLTYFASFLLCILYIMIQNGLLFESIDTLPKYKIHNGNSTRKKAITREDKESKDRMKLIDVPLIYLHTKRLHSSIMYDELCELTRDPSKFVDSNAVVFHAKDLPLPEHFVDLRKKPGIVDQLWVYFNLESPKNTRKLPQNEMLFNLTITPKRSSDIFHPYAYYRKREMLLDEVDKEFGSIELAEKTKFIAWCVSNCAVRRRNDFVQLMQRYAQVDVFGGCSKYFGAPAACKRNSKECIRYLSQYKFYLAFENSLCEDYITEKYWGALDRGNVPVVMAMNVDTLIPGSYIDASKFKTVEDLIKYLKYLDKNDDAYLKYFEWRKKFEIDFEPADARRTDIWLPQLCDLLLNRDWSKRNIVNISRFYGVKQNCPQEKENEILRIIEKGV